MILAGPASGNRGELGLASTYGRRNRCLPSSFSRLRAALGAISAFQRSVDLRAEIAASRCVLIDDVLSLAATLDAHEQVPLRAKAVPSTCWLWRGLWMTPKLPYNCVIAEFDRERQARDMTAAIEIYTRPGCGYCSAAKSLLNRKRAAFVEYDGGKDPNVRQAMYDRAGAGSTFPQIFFGEMHVGGCDELYALDREGKLDAMLNGQRAS